jgi:hypothetical protein
VKFLLKLGWWAHRSGHRRTTAIYACKALALAPLNWEAWMMLKASGVGTVRRRTRKPGVQAPFAAPA